MTPKSGIRLSSASAGSPGQTQTQWCFSATGKLRTRAAAGICAWLGIWTQAPSGAKRRP